MALASPRPYLTPAATIPKIVIKGRWRSDDFTFYLAKTGLKTLDISGRGAVQ
jgi:hypothetical protein